MDSQMIFVILASINPPNLDLNTYLPRGLPLILPGTASKWGVVADWVNGKYPWQGPGTWSSI